jgi:hypothetical protein
MRVGPTLGMPAMPVRSMRERSMPVTRVCSMRVTRVGPMPVTPAIPGLTPVSIQEMQEMPELMTPELMTQEPTLEGTPGTTVAPAWSSPVRQRWTRTPTA